MTMDTKQSLTHNLLFLIFALNILLVQCIQCVCGQTSDNVSMETTAMLVTNATTTSITSIAVTGFNLAYLGLIIPIVVIVLVVIIVCIIKRKAIYSLSQPCCCSLPYIP